MNLVTQATESLVRAAIIAGVSVAVSGSLSAWLRTRTGRTRTVAGALLLAPFFTPALLISYAFSRFALELVISPWSHEALYVGVLALKLIPVAVVVRTLLPSPLPPEAWHSFRLMGSVPWWSRASFHLRGAGVGPWIAGGSVFLVAFSDFELASLWSVRTWTVALFDAQTGGLALTETLRLAVSPLAVELAVLALIYRWAGRAARPSLARFDRAANTPPTFAMRLSWLYLATSAALVCLLPLTIVASQAATGFRTLTESFIFSSEFGASLLFAAGAAVFADALARFGRKRPSTALLLATPGLVGALTVSLFVLTLFQTTSLHAAYDTPLPLLLALTIVLLPLALLLSGLRSVPFTSLHVARQLGSRQLVWEMETRPHFAAFGLIFCCAWFDFTASSILAPVGLTPVFVRLHNLAHYGQTAVLSAMMFAAFTFPVLALLFAGLTARLLGPRRASAFRC